MGVLKKGWQQPVRWRRQVQQEPRIFIEEP